jgi:streptomycin 6-kinase
VVRRAQVLAEVNGLDQKRILKCAQAESVLSAWWHCEDKDPEWKQAIPLAEVIASAAGRIA